MLRRRPWWMNVLLLFCAFMTFVYVPWDFFCKPVAADQEAWFGLLLHGWAAKLTEPIHWAIYAAGTVGLWRMRGWMWPWAALYAGQVTLGMLVWSVCWAGGFSGVAMGLAASVPFVLLTRALWKARELFEAMPPKLSERYGPWALVTGASAGIGTAFVHALARDGVSCVLVARRKERLDELARTLEERYGVECRVVAADLADEGAVEQIARAVEDLDLAILVNNAGFGGIGRFEKISGEHLADMVKVNCLAPVTLTHRLLPRLRERGCGAVIFTGSIAGHIPLPLHAVYSATKSFDRFLGESLWAELRDSGIDVLVVEPGPVATEFAEVAGEVRDMPEARPEEVVDTALDALGTRPSVVHGWGLWAGAWFLSLLPRSLLTFIDWNFAAAETPEEMR
ncbi:MAG: SDR family oxidoreductase [Deltaproteobacteria bacterium]|nr:MAG: SDR family oxidoreductase [Deltaproteobacteria bacterium]